MKAICCLIRSSLRSESRVIGLNSYESRYELKSDFLHFAYVLSYIDVYDPSLITEEILHRYIDSSFATDEEKKALHERVAYVVQKTGRFAISERTEFVAMIYTTYISP